MDKFNHLGHLPQPQITFEKAVAKICFTLLGHSDDQQTVDIVTMRLNDLLSRGKGLTMEEKKEKVKNEARSIAFILTGRDTDEVALEFIESVLDAIVLQS